MTAYIFLVTKYFVMSIWVSILSYFFHSRGVDGLDFTTARRMLCAILKDELDRHYYLKTSDVLTDEDRILFTKMLHGQDDNIEDSIRMLSKLLYKHYGQKVVILIDEYDVPLDKAFQNGYYKEMVSLIGGFSGRRSRQMSFTVCGAHGLPSRVKGEHFYRTQ